MKKKSHLQRHFIFKAIIPAHIGTPSWMDGWMISGQKNNFLLSHNSLANHAGLLDHPISVLRSSQTKD
jgi:hypothetical protein